MKNQNLRPWTSNAKQALPDPVVARIRDLLRGWGTLTAPWRILPDFIVIGAQRSGTTTLYRLLSSHPQVVRPTATKGIKYFEDCYKNGQRWYRGHFPLQLTAKLLAQGEPRTFESSGFYSFHPLAAQRIAKDLPGTKLVMMLRDPVDRAYSAHRHELMRGFESEKFERALELEAERVEGEIERLEQDPGYSSYNLRHHAYLLRGRYIDQIRRIHNAVGEESLYLMDADDFFSNPQEEFLALQLWLGLEPWAPDAVPAENAQPRAPMSEQLRQKLRSHYDSADAELAQIMGKQPSWRR
ncbi:MULTISPECIES: sulfotransferase family protein [Glutamicibacter]|uniref:sulfotransferase family protein n=1 Tax=Glutamicibacter TaxID=1742989 RepID=UPI000EBF4A3B|nr:sulfotransferase [Glutamicibacter sp.]HCJ54897.1 sulfotransferase [Glutamicibacter sp.]